MKVYKDGHRIVGSLSDKFWARVSKDPTHPKGCWEWIAGKFDNGYGSVGIRGKTEKASRLSWEITTGVPAGTLYVLHHCDNPICVRPDHLFLGTAKDNALDCKSKGRNTRVGNYYDRRTHCKNGHEFTLENTSIYMEKGKWRVRKCKECSRIRSRKYKAEHRCKI